MEIRWDKKKNAELRSEERPCFELVEQLIRSGEFTRFPHHSNPNQILLVVMVNNYPHVVPAEDRGHLWLVTVYPSRKFLGKV